LVFIIRIYQDARSSECQIYHNTVIFYTLTANIPTHSEKKCCKKFV